MDELKVTKPNLFDSINKFRTKHEPEILMGVGIAGLLFSTAWVITATVKAVKLIEKKKKELGRDKLTAKETFKIVWKLYLPVVLSTGISIPCIIAGNRISSKRTAALAAAYAFSETALHQYQNKTKELIGEDKEMEIREEVVKDSAKRIESKEIILSGSDEQLFLESLTGRYFKSTWNDIQKACNELNEEALCDSNGSYTLDDWFDKLGLESTELGALLGWALPYYGNSAGLMKIHMTTSKTKDNRPCGAICYDVEPYKIGG